MEQGPYQIRGRRNFSGPVPEPPYSPIAIGVLEIRNSCSERSYGQGFGLWRRRRKKWLPRGGRTPCELAGRSLWAAGYRTPTRPGSPALARRCRPRRWPAARRVRRRRGGRRRSLRSGLARRGRRGRRRASRQRASRTPRVPGWSLAAGCPPIPSIDRPRPRRLSGRGSRRRRCRSSSRTSCRWSGRSGWETPPGRGPSHGHEMLNKAMAFLFSHDRSNEQGEYHRNRQM